MHQQPITNSAFPLSWPPGRKRTEPHRRAVAKFGQRSFAVARDELLAELKRLGGVRQIVLSTNVELRQDGLPYAGRRAPDDPGVALYFVDRKGRQMAFACDRWRHIEDNMRAIEKTVEALRGIERWGSGEMLDAAFTGFQALPAPPAAKPWWEVLGCPAHAPTADVHLAYRRALMNAHPDRAGSSEQVHAVESAYAAFRAERGL
jgi:hypothetical protein